MAPSPGCRRHSSNSKRRDTQLGTSRDHSVKSDVVSCLRNHAIGKQSEELVIDEKELRVSLCIFPVPFYVFVINSAVFLVSNFPSYTSSGLCESRQLWGGRVQGCA